MLDIAFDAGYASLFGFIWAFKLVRYAPGLASLRRVISNARHALLSVLLGFGILLLLAASLVYLLERTSQPEDFGSIPAALWWAIVTMTTTGYGDVVPHTALGRMLAGVVMVSCILVFALWAGILATGYAEETRRREFLRTWDLVAKVPFLHDVGAAVIADVTQLLQRDPQAEVCVRVARVDGNGLLKCGDGVRFAASLEASQAEIMMNGGVEGLNQRWTAAKTGTARPVVLGAGC